VAVAPLVLGNGVLTVGPATSCSSSLSLSSREAAVGRRPELVITPSVQPSDTTPPTVPARLAAGAGGRTSIALSWSSATDDTAVAGYAVYRDGGATPLATTTGAGATSFTDTGLQPGTSYSYEVAAVDAAGN